MGVEKSHSRLGTRLRGRLSDEYSKRGHQCSHLWYVYSPRTDRDWVLRGDLEWAHFLLAESDPLVHTVDYSPEHLIFPNDVKEQDVEFSALVTFSDGLVEYRDIQASEKAEKNPTAASREVQRKSELVEAQGGKYVRYTEREILASPQKLLNWQRIIAWLSATRGRSLYAETVEILAFLHAHGSAPLGRLQSLSQGPSSACYVAAAFKGVQDGILLVDIEKRPLNKNTIFTVGGDTL